MKYWAKVKNKWSRYWYKKELLKQKALLNEILKAGKNVKVEQTDACWHNDLKKLDGFWYECSKCGRIYMFPVDYGFERSDLAKQFATILHKTKGKK